MDAYIPVISPESESPMSKMLSLGNTSGIPSALYLIRLSGIPDTNTVFLNAVINFACAGNGPKSSGSVSTPRLESLMPSSVAVDSLSCISFKK